jgi:hypothetical protein
LEFHHLVAAVVVIRSIIRSIFRILIGIRTFFRIFFRILLMLILAGLLLIGASRGALGLLVQKLGPGRQ